MPSGSGGNIAPYAARRDRDWRPASACRSYVPPGRRSSCPTCRADCRRCAAASSVRRSRRLAAVRAVLAQSTLEFRDRLALRGVLSTQRRILIPIPTHAEATRSLAQRHRGRLQARRLGKQNRELIPNILSEVHAKSANAMAAAGGLFAGLFWGRTLGQFARAMQADGEPVTLRGLVDLVTARPSPSAP